ncbi:MAG: TolC family protein [Pirellulales bacterium]|nr:TolC family protein [Pirellulales bacterium]
MVAVCQVSCFWHRDVDYCWNTPCDELLAPSGGPSQLEIDEPCLSPCCDSSVIPPAPETIPANGDITTFDLTLEQAIMIALGQSKVMRDLGGTILRSPDSVPSVYDPALAYTDPRFGEEAALSAFDALFSAQGSWQQNDRLYNNTFIGDRGLFEQDYSNYSFELSKRSVLGTRMAFRHVIDYDLDNSIGNQRDPSILWGAYFDAEVRHPLLQGSGLLFNRIAGPTTQPGDINGVLLARTRTDIDLAEFEAGVRNLVTNVENAYWDLYFAYRDLDAKKRARDKALETWIKIKENLKHESGNITISDETQAKEQYWRFQSEVLDALTGRLTDATRTDNGSAAGTFRSSGGVRVAERRLRLILGLPINSVQIIKPISEPPQAPVQFDWEVCATEAIAQRAELRRQRWIVKQHELELLASRNFLLPRLDAIARYRMRGFGHDMISQSDQDLDSAYGGLGDHNEWQLGVEFEVPLGFRRAHAGVRNAEFALARARSVLRESEQHVLYGLSNAFGEMERSFQLVSAQYNRLQAAKQSLEAAQTNYDEERVTIDIVLEAQRREAEADIRYYQARIEYALAMRGIHYEKGTLLEFNNVYLTESGSPPAAWVDVQNRLLQQRPKLSYVCRDIVISKGEVSDQVLPTIPGMVEVQEMPGEQVMELNEVETSGAPGPNAGTKLREGTIPIREAQPSKIPNPLVEQSDRITVTDQQTKTKKSSENLSSPAPSPAGGAGAADFGIDSKKQTAFSQDPSNAIHLKTDGNVPPISMPWPRVSIPESNITSAARVVNMPSNSHIQKGQSFVDRSVPMDPKMALATDQRSKKPENDSSSTVKQLQDPAGMTDPSPSKSHSAPTAVEPKPMIQTQFLR